MYSADLEKYLVRILLGSAMFQQGSFCSSLQKGFWGTLKERFARIKKSSETPEVVEPQPGVGLQLGVGQQQQVAQEPVVQETELFQFLVGRLV